MREKAAWSRQAGIRKASESEPLMKRRKIRDGIKTGVCALLRDKPGGYPFYWPGGVRREDGASLVCGYCTERGKAGVDTVTVTRKSIDGERERAGRLKP
jgi:hypothetical protein